MKVETFNSQWTRIMKKNRKPQTESQMYHSLVNVMDRTYENLIDHILVKINDGYVLNNQYSIKTSNNQIAVTRRRDMSVTQFNSVKMALIWSILDYNSKFYESTRIRILDNVIVSLELEKKIHERLRNKDPIIYDNKLQQDTARLKKYRLEINKHIRLANTLQKKELQK